MSQFSAENTPIFSVTWSF